MLPAATHHPLLELTTSCVNVSAAGVPDGRLDADLAKFAYEVLRALGGGGLELRAWNRVQLNDVYVRQGVAAELAEVVQFLVGVVDALDEGVLIGRPTAGLINVFTHGVIQMQQ